MELESEIKDFHTRLRIIDRDYVACQKELEKLKDENREMQKEKYDLERQNAALSAKVEALASQIDDKNKLAQKNEDSLRITDDVLKSRDQTINELKEKVKYLKNKLEDSCSRIDKCNQIIEKHEKDVEKKKDSIKLKNDIIRQQESKINQLDETISNLKSASLESERAKELKDREIDSLNRMAEGLRSKLEVADHSLQDKESLIKYLSSQISELKGVTPIGDSILKKPLYTALPETSSTFMPSSSVRREPLGGSGLGLTYKDRAQDMDTISGSGAIGGGLGNFTGKFSVQGSTNPDRVSSRRAKGFETDYTFERQGAGHELGLTNGDRGGGLDFSKRNGIEALGEYSKRPEPPKPIPPPSSAAISGDPQPRSKDQPIFPIKF